jgi:hypothetical protein
VKFLRFCDGAGREIRCLQQAAIDDAARVRAIEVYRRQTQENAANSWTMSLPSSPFGYTSCVPTMAAILRPRSGAMVEASGRHGLGERALAYCASIVSRKEYHITSPEVPFNPKEAIRRTAFDQLPARAGGRLRCHGTALPGFHDRLFHYTRRAPLCHCFAGNVRRVLG